MRLLHRSGITFDSLGYSHSVYGRPDEQHNLINRLLAHGYPSQRRKIWIYDDFMDSPVLQLRNDLQTSSLTAAETPLSVFVALPLVLSFGYRYLCFAHEKSADFGNCTWELTGETINHQWGKSTEAEILMDEYINSNLIRNVNVFSILKLLYDLGIFSLLQREVDGLSAAHSCNVEKPWCMKCPKCAYVWLNYKAWFKDETVDPIFSGRNLFDIEENQLAFHQLLGMDKHTPFECVGTVSESRLAFELCRMKGLAGRAMDGYVQSGIQVPDPMALAHEHLRLADYSHMPSRLAPAISALLKQAEPNGLAYISSVMG